MINISKYIHSKQIIDEYLKNIDILKDYDEYQHFISRLNIVRKKQTNSKYFTGILDNLKESVSIDLDTMMHKLLDNDSNGYLTEIYETHDEELYRYFYITHIADFYSITIRNHVELDRDLNNKIINLISNDDTVDMLCRVSKNNILREKEGTWCTNGIGYVLFYGNLTDDNRVKLEKSFIDLFKYYLEKFDIQKRNYVYGLTHCILHLSYFYTKSISKNYFSGIEDLCHKTIDLLDNVFSSFKNVNQMNSDMLAELLVINKMLLMSKDSTYETKNSAIAYNELVRRIDFKYKIIMDHKAEKLVDIFRLNEHTNILFILYCRL